MPRQKVLIIVGMVALGVALVVVNLGFQRPTGLEVTVETLSSRDLVARVSGSGRIQPQREVDVSSNTMGRVTRLAVVEGQQVEKGQFLLEIDPRSLEGQLQSGEASVAAARSVLAEARAGVDLARANLELARQRLQREQGLWAGELTTLEALERARNDVAVRQTKLLASQQEVETREQQIRQEEASLATTKYRLSQVVITAPADGMVTRRNVEEGENVVVGTMNNAGTVLLTLTDMSSIDAEVELDETAIPAIQLGQSAVITIDAFPDRTFRARVSAIGNSPIETASPQSAAQRPATKFMVVVTLEEEVPGVRPGFTCTAEITTATRRNVLAVPIQSLTVQEVLYDVDGQLVQELPSAGRRAARISINETSLAVEPPPGFTREETQGVFVLRQGRAVFTPVTLGIADERYFEVVSGLDEGDRVITGPFAAARRLVHGDEVRITEAS